MVLQSGKGIHDELDVHGRSAQEVRCRVEGALRFWGLGLAVEAAFGFGDEGV